MLARVIISTFSMRNQNGIQVKWRERWSRRLLDRHNAKFRRFLRYKWGKNLRNLILTLWAELYTQWPFFPSNKISFDMIPALPIIIIGYNLNLFIIGYYISLSYCWCERDILRKDIWSSYYPSAIITLNKLDIIEDIICNCIGMYNKSFSAPNTIDRI